MFLFKEKRTAKNLGKGPTPCRLILNPGTPEERELPALISLELHAGDVLRHELSGGSGYGNPLARDRDAVMRDVQNEYVSAEAAEKEYGPEKATLETSI